MQYVSGSGTIVTQHKTGCGSQFGGHVCARQDDECQCPALVGVASGTHMAVGQGYTISSSVSSGSEFEIYALSGSDPVPNTTNGSIHVGD
ncbi:MAG TPA: hypothetical protein VHW23_02720 [Kofleriaceae bacterium]|nr:hypothetical protein [Kofleriaceae bacterium]